mgnify:FL=1
MEEGNGTDFVISGLIICELDIVAAIRSVPRRISSQPAHPDHVDVVSSSYLPPVGNPARRFDTSKLLGCNPLSPARYETMRHRPGDVVLMIPGEYLRR